MKIKHLGVGYKIMELYLCFQMIIMLARIQLGNHVNLKKMYGASRIHHDNIILNDVLSRNVLMYVDQLCKMSSFFKLDVLPVSGFVQGNGLSVIPHSRVNYLRSLDAADKEKFVKDLYQEKVDYFVSSISRWSLLHGHIEYHAWSNSGVLAQDV